MGYIKKDPPSLSEINSRFSYDPDTGIFKHKRSYSRAPAGKDAGCDTVDGYKSLCFDNGRYMAHRIAWLLIKNDWPKEDIDHINGIKSDNRIENLRVLTRSHNNQNTIKASKNNKTGYLGVSLHKKSGLYRATIFVNYKQTNIGYYKTAKEASEAYLAKKREIHKSFNEDRE